MSIALTVTGNIGVTDPDTGTLTITKQISQAFAGSTSMQAEAVTIGTSPVAIILPITPTQVVYVANLSQTNNVTVTWTPSGQSSAVVQNLGPLAMILSVESTTSVGGITALTLTASGANTLVDYFLAG